MIHKTETKIEKNDQPKNFDEKYFSADRAELKPI